MEINAENKKKDKKKNRESKKSKDLEELEDKLKIFLSSKDFRDKRNVLNNFLYFLLEDILINKRKSKILNEFEEINKSSKQIYDKSPDFLGVYEFDFPKTYKIFNLTIVDYDKIKQRYNAKMLARFINFEKRISFELSKSKIHEYDIEINQLNLRKSNLKSLLPDVTFFYSMQKSGILEDDSFKDKSNKKMKTSLENKCIQIIDMEKQEGSLYYKVFKDLKIWYSDRSIVKPCEEYSNSFLLELKD